MPAGETAPSRDLDTDGGILASSSDPGLQQALRRLGITDLAEAGALIGRDSAARALVMRLARLTMDTPAQSGTDGGTQRAVRSIAEEYLDLSVAALQRAQVRVDDLTASATVLADLARMVRVVPLSKRPAMEGLITGQLQDEALPHYERVVRALSATGALDALEAERHHALRNLDDSWLPPLDAELLRRAGYSDPETTLALTASQAQSMPDRMPSGTYSLQDVMREGKGILEAPRGDAPPGERRAKRWTGIGKILTGAALAGGNIAGGALLGLGTAGASVGATWLGVIGSAGVGVGMVFEGVGAIRGE